MALELKKNTDQKAYEDIMIFGLNYFIINLKITLRIYGRYMPIKTFESIRIKKKIIK